ncbi:baseplate J/gp47 family protein [Ferriphaselus sp. R-1]|uniref:baseplate J/gp47 family protein n=1 Tax=Ferriphaselus sp. R-1 TaxID=1485544 RepID=UPI0005555835|nr:baseplate J/gp47 family protein [Ferriphaselus sp. R-1]
MTPYNRPSYTELLTRIESDLAALPAVLRRPLAATWARVANGEHGHLDWIDAQCSPLTCELERLYDWAALYGADRLLATPASGAALATGNAGAQVLAGTLLRGGNGLDYSVQAAVVLGAGSTSVSLRCATSGAAGNLVAGQLLTLVDPLAGVNNTFTVGVLGMTGGAEDELVDAWRARVADEWRTVVTEGARSGKPKDYRHWAKSAHPSVTGALVQLHTLGVGTVVVRPVCNGLADRLPTQAVLNAVAAYFDPVVPATADWRVVSPTAHPVTLSIHLLPAVDTAQNRAAISASLNDLILSKGGTDTEVLTVLWAEVDTVIALTTNQYTLDESVPIVWAAHEVPVLQPVVWI